MPKTANKTKAALAALLALCAVGAMFWVEQVLRPGYFVKSGCKLALFGGCILLYRLLSGVKLPCLLGLRPFRGWKMPLALGLAGEAAILLLFFLLREQLALDALRQSLMTKEGLTKENCLFIMGYIICVNSFLEEAFFRGFLYHALGQVVPARWAAAGSALLFALYHIGIVSAWFSPAVFAACILLLAAAGLVLQWVKERSRSLYASWMIHALANGAINTIGAALILLG